MPRWRGIVAVVLALALVVWSTRLDKAGGSHPAKPVHLRLANNNSIALYVRSELRTSGRSAI